jgi:chorismate mutase
MDIDNLEREKDIIEHLSNKANHNLKKEDISAIFKLIFNISKNLQKIK